MHVAFHVDVVRYHMRTLRRTHRSTLEETAARPRSRGEPSRAPRCAAERSRAQRSGPQSRFALPPNAPWRLPYARARFAEQSSDLSRPFAVRQRGDCGVACEQGSIPAAAFSARDSSSLRSLSCSSRARSRCLACKSGGYCPPWRNSCRCWYLDFDIPGLQHKSGSQLVDAGATHQGRGPHEPRPSATQLGVRAQRSPFLETPMGERGTYCGSRRGHVQGA